MGKYKQRAMTGKFSSQKQIAKFKKLLASGAISQETFNNWMGQTQNALSDNPLGINSLPERSSSSEAEKEDD